METDSQTPLEVAALGRPFQLGMLYDCRNDRLIPGITLWDHEDLQKNTNERIQHNTEFDVIASDSAEDKAWALDVDASLKVSFVGGLVEVGGSAKYLNDTKASKKQARVTLKYKTTTKFIELSMKHLGRGNVKHPYVFEKGIATHVVTAVLYGAQAFFVFDREVSETEDQQNIKGNLQVMIKGLPKLSIDGKGSLKLTDTDKTTEEKLSCKFYGDFALEQNPVSYQDAVKIYRTLPGLLGEKGENAVPVRVWLLPLEILDSSAARLVCQISVSLVNQTQSVIEDFNEIEMQCNDIKTRKVIKYFPKIDKKVKFFKDMCLEYKSVFQSSLSRILPSIRGGGTEECVLANILKNKEQSPFNSNKLKEWLDCKEQEINLLQTYTDMMEDTKILASKSELESEILKNRDKHVVCFAFTSLGEEEPYLLCLRSHLKALSTAKLTDPTEEDRKDVQLCEFNHSDAMLEKMKEQAILFMDFVKANKENKKTHFISASIPNDKYKGASIYLYTDGIEKSDHFDPPSKPERPNPSDVTHDSVKIKLNHPQYGSSEITHYLVEYCANESDDWQFFEVSKSNLECTVSGLLPHTGYRVRYKAVCPAGVSLTSEAESIKTLPTSPPGKPEETHVDLEEITVNWTKPDIVGNGVSIENYIVEYRTETNGNKADWKKKTSKGEVFKITGLQPDTAYYIRITCNCGEFGQSKESLTVSISTVAENVSAHIPVSDIPELIKILKQNKDELEGQCRSSSEHRSSTVKATCTVTNSLNSLCQTLSDQQQHEAELLVLSRIDALGYCCESKTFNHLLDWNEISFLQNEIERSYTEYCSLKEQSASKAQAYVFLKVLTSSKDQEYISSEKKEARLELIKSHLKDNILNAIKLLVEKCHGNWELLEEELNSFIKESNLKEENIKKEDTASLLGSLPGNQVSLSEETTNFTDIPPSEMAIDNSINLFKRLGLSDRFPKKIKLNDILVIDSLSLCLNEPDTVEDLKSQYLYKLMILDYNVRYLSFKPVATGSLLEDNGTMFDDFDFFNTNEEPTREADLADTESHIHPMDIHMAIFHCANDFMRQYMYTKLSACQFALPFLVPKPCTKDLEFPLWPLRHIKKSWKSMTNSSADNPGKYQARQIFSTPVPVVSFLRLGSSLISKSQILNSVISKQKHNVFFNRHCKGSAPSSVLMNGVVEIAWYCPGGKKDDIFDDCVAFLNLHGDAKDHQQQLQFLQAVSTVNVLLLSEQPQDEETKTLCQNLSTSPIPLICLFSGSERVQGSKNPLKVRLAAKNRNEAELTEELITNIKQCIGKYNKKQSIEDCFNEARKLKFKVDEDKQSFKDGHELAQTLVCLLKKKCISDIKKEFLPLHGELWHKWCLKNKQQYRLSCKTNATIEQQKSIILSDMEATRKKQWEIASSHNDFMTSFLDCLTSNDHSEDTKFYMLQWLRVLLDELSSDHLAGLEENYHSTWSQMKNVPKTKEKAEELEMLSKQLNSISEKMAASTIGLQHIMREVGQMHECSVIQSVGALPALGAEMLISGYPLELMDGDESHVPLIWVQAVLQSLIDKLGDKKVYVLSILGLQSSGKSTLLNTMFGLQFTVSAGRCTRGAFMQMIKVDEKIREELGFDFLLVVDTEGLRSPELSTKTSLNHDNELATFIIGIGDMTVINFMGENPSEMHEILQICVQAFLRMKRVEIKPSCIFVHQNVAEASAGDKNMEGRRRLQEKLDEMAQTAAKEEGTGEVYSFSDVIQFDLESQVFYFKNLLEGDPPMAPPNPSYSQNVQDLKSKLLSVAKWQTGFRFPSLSEFSVRVKDLWNALLQENFVFSFRNTLEIMLYSSLEEKYAQWSWKLRKYSLETQTKLENQIGSNNISDVNTTDLISAFDDVYTGLKEAIEAHFKDDKHAEVLIKWKGNVENRLESLKNELIEKTLKQCKMLIENKRSITDLEQKKSHYEKNLMQKSKTMATSLKDKRLTDNEVEKEFSSLWVEWVAEIAKDQLPDEPVNIKAIVQAILYSHFQKQADIMNKIKTISENGTFEFTKKKHINQSYLAAKWESFKEKIGMGYLQELAGKLHRSVNHMVDEYIRKKELEKTDFNQNFIFEILDEIERHIQECERNEHVKFTYEYRVDLSVFVCLGSVKRFKKMHESFKKANNPITYLQSKREQYSEMFLNYCKEANSVTIFAEFLFKNILPAVEEAIYNEIKLQIIDFMTFNNPAFSGNRCNLENHILRNLAIQKNFDFYNEYIHNPKWYFKRFIDEHVETFCEDYKKLKEMFHGNLEKIKLHILHTSTEVSEEVNLKKGNASMWLNHFCAKLGDHMVIKRESLTSIQDEDISDTKFLKEMMAKYLEEVVKSENMKSVDASSQHLCLLKQKITEILFKQLEGCWAQCPFCKAICTNTIVNHSGDHRVQFHRSCAMGHWHYRETDEFTNTFCTTDVSSNGSFIIHPDLKRIPYKSYRDAGDPYDKWSITADGSTQGYWKWFICRFQKDWEDRCGYKFKGRGAIPDSWREITEESVLKELNIRD
ncbi:interferon-induced very large GTPase 1-like [Brienomyrus brachyistius]|uniref:interferon-induced very large GTPase 1-like n=1 Tax=Brienomyrus brachyistius TaxID=42636 RepID=UPI0020B1A888|nr:interferon-induced very large GTPase 1-like [Brienomyrus brachyistius]